MAVETNCGHNQQLTTRRSTKGGKGDTGATMPKVDNNRRNTRCKDEIKKFGNKLHEYCFGEYDDEERSRKASSAYAQRLHLSFQKICVLYYYKHIPPLSLCIKM